MAGIEYDIKVNENTVVETLLINGKTYTRTFNKRLRGSLAGYQASDFSEQA